MFLQKRIDLIDCILAENAPVLRYDPPEEFLFYIFVLLAQFP